MFYDKSRLRGHLENVACERDEKEKPTRKLVKDASRMKNDDHRHKEKERGRARGKEKKRKRWSVCTA